MPLMRASVKEPDITPDICPADELTNEGTEGAFVFTNAVPFGSFGWKRNDGRRAALRAPSAREMGDDSTALVEGKASAAGNGKGAEKYSHDDH